MPLLMSVSIEDNGEPNVQVVGDDRLALRYGVKVLSIIAGILDEMALDAARNCVDADMATKREAVEK